jgi:hypothetical protein
MNTEGKQGLGPEEGSHHHGQMQNYQAHFNALDFSEPSTFMTANVTTRINTEEGGLNLGRVMKTIQRQIRIII